MKEFLKHICTFCKKRVELQSNLKTIICVDLFFIDIYT